MDYIELLNAQQVLLSGIYSNQNSNTCVVYIPGLGATFSSSNIPRFIANKCHKNKIDFLYASNQGSGIITELLVLGDENQTFSKQGGACYENYNNWFYDIDVWIKYLSKYENIIIIAHSLGCNKIIDYVSKVKNKKIKQIILLSPQDMRFIMKLEKHNGLYEEAIENSNNGVNNLLTKQFLGFCYLSTDTYLDFYQNNEINNIPYLTENIIDKFKKTDVPINIIIGSLDKKIDLKPHLKKIAIAHRNLKFKIIDGANHNYNNMEKKLINIIFKTLLLDCKNNC